MNVQLRSCNRRVLRRMGFIILVAVLIIWTFNDRLTDTSRKGTVEKINSIQPELQTSSRQVAEKATDFSRATYQHALSNCNVPILATWDQYYDLLGTFHPCNKMQRFGGVTYRGYTDGDKQVCLDGDLALLSRKCTVLSFGISNEWSFDNAMDKWGCKVYSFDPTMGRNNFNKSANIQFYNLVLGYSKSTIVIHKKSYPVDSYRGILDMLGLLHTTIDYLKVDIEGSERDFFRNILNEEPELLANVKQIGMEIHHGKGNWSLANIYWKDIHRMSCASFRRIYATKNLYKDAVYQYKQRNVSEAYEIVWINEKFL